MVVDESTIPRVAPSQDQLQDITVAAQRLLELEKLIETGEEDLKRLREEFNHIASRTLPDLLDQAGVDRVGVASHALDIVLTPFYDARWPKEEGERDAATAWLVTEGHGDLIKDQVSVPLGRSQHNLASMIVAGIRTALDNAGAQDVPVLREQTVHPMTLKAFLREEIEQGRSVPLELFGATIGRVAKIKRRK